MCCFYVFNGLNFQNKNHINFQTREWMKSFRFRYFNNFFPEFRKEFKQKQSIWYSPELSIKFFSFKLHIVS